MVKHNIITTYYEQNQAEALNGNKQVIELIFERAPDWTQQKVRTFLGGFSFYKDTVFKYVKQLSGGEKARLALALMLSLIHISEPTRPY